MDSAAAGFLLPEQRADRARVTAGMPSLTSAKRVQVEYHQKQDIKQASVQAVAQLRQSELTAPDGEIPTTVLEAQLGRPMTSAEIAKRLLKLNPNLIFERSLADPSTMGIYLPDPETHGGRRFLMGFEFGYSPEFTVNGNDARGRYQEKRGWRQIIARLARMGHISLSAAERLFETARGRASRNWQTLTT